MYIYCISLAISLSASVSGLVVWFGSIGSVSLGSIRSRQVRSVNQSVCFVGSSVVRKTDS